MINKLSAAAVTVIFLIGIVFAGCSDNSPSANVGSNADAASITAQNISQSELTLMSAAGINVLDGKGVFSIGWRQLFDPRNQVETTVGHAMAVGFGDNASSGPGRRGGIDMGSVFVNYADNHLGLQKHTSRDGKVVYTSALGPKAGNTRIEFVPNGTYQFEVTGSSGFTAMNTALTAPAALLNITSPEKGDSMSSANDLTLTWEGGNTNAGVLIAVAPMPPRPALGPPNGGMGNHGPGNGPSQGPGGFGGGGHQGPGNGPPMGQPGGHPPMLDSAKAIIVKLDNNTGSYTVTASQLQDLISKTHAGGFMCTVSQMSVNDVDHDGGTVHVVFRNGDGVMIKVK